MYESALPLQFWDELNNEQQNELERSIQSVDIEEANDRLSRQNGMVASFSRALAEGLSAQQSADEFDATLDASIASIAAASAT